jgi:hypothetical protein
MMAGRIRLGCISCWRDDFDAIDELPADWEDIDEVQSYEDSVREVHHDDPGADIIFWETHMGVCPECQNTRDVRVDSQRVLHDVMEAQLSGSSTVTQ